MWGILNRGGEHGDGDAWLWKESPAFQQFGYSTLRTSLIVPCRPLASKKSTDADLPQPFNAFF